MPFVCKCNLKNFMKNRVTLSVLIFVYTNGTHIISLFARCLDLYIYIQTFHSFFNFQYIYKRARCLLLMSAIVISIDIKKFLCEMSYIHKKNPVYVRFLKAQKLRVLLSNKKEILHLSKKPTIHQLQNYAPIYEIKTCKNLNLFQCMTQFND